MSKVVEKSIKINDTPEKVLGAFVEEEVLKEWWGVQVSLIELKKGGIYTLTWDVTESGFRYISTGIVASYIPHKKLVVENYLYLNPSLPIIGPMRLEIEVSGGDSTLLTVRQSGEGEGADWDFYFEAINTAWPDVLKILKDFMEGNLKIIEHDFF